MGRIVAAVTCDVVKSQRYPTELRKTIDTLLKKEFRKVIKTYPGILGRF